MLFYTSLLGFMVQKLMLENSKKLPLQVLWAQGNVFKWLFVFYLFRVNSYLHAKSAPLKSEHICVFTYLLIYVFFDPLLRLGTEFDTF